MRFFPVLFLAMMVSSCSDRIQVQAGYYAVKTRMGEIKDVIEGPATTVKSPFLEHVVIFDKNRNLVIQLPDDQQIELSIEVIDPKLFYLLSAGRYETLASYYESKIDGLSRQDATELLIKELNKPDTGITVELKPGPENNYY